MMAVRDPYQTLGVGRDAGDDEIKKAYRRMARKYHPDVNKAPGAKEKFLEVSQAYDMLKTSQKRAQHRMGMGGMGGFGQEAYGQGGFSQGQGGFGQGGFGQGGFGQGGFQGGFHAENVSFEEMMDQMKAMFEEAFGAQFGHRSPDAPQDDSVLRQLGQEIPDTFVVFNEMLPGFFQKGDDFFLGVDSDEGALGTLRGVVKKHRMQGEPETLELKEINWVIQTMGWSSEMLTGVINDDPEGKKSTLVIKSPNTGKEWGRMVTRSQFLGPIVTQHDFYNDRGAQVLTGYRICFLGTRITLNYAEGHSKEGTEAALFKRSFISFGKKYRAATNTSYSQLHPGIYLVASAYWHWLDQGSSPLRGLLSSIGRWLATKAKELNDSQKKGP